MSEGRAPDYPPSAMDQELAGRANVLFEKLMDAAEAADDSLVQELLAQAFELGLPVVFLVLCALADTFVPGEGAPIKVRVWNEKLGTVLTEEEMPEPLRFAALFIADVCNGNLPGAISRWFALIPRGPYETARAAGAVVHLAINGFRAARGKGEETP